MIDVMKHWPASGTSGPKHVCSARTIRAWSLASAIVARQEARKRGRHSFAFQYSNFSNFSLTLVGGHGAWGSVWRKASAFLGERDLKLRLEVWELGDHVQSSTWIIERNMKLSTEWEVFDDIRTCAPITSGARSWTTSR